MVPLRGSQWFLFQTKILFTPFHHTVDSAIQNQKYYIIYIICPAYTKQNILEKLLTMEITLVLKDLKSGAINWQDIIGQTLLHSQLRKFYL